MILHLIEKLIQGALKELDLPAEIIKLEHPADLANGDYSTNIALILAKQLKENPHATAEKIVTALQGSTLGPEPSKTSYGAGLKKGRIL